MSLLKKIPKKKTTKPKSNSALDGFRPPNLETIYKDLPSIFDRLELKLLMFAVDTWIKAYRKAALVPDSETSRNMDEMILLKEKVKALQGGK